MIPDYQSLMLPVLRFVSDGQEYTVREVIEGLSKIFHLSEIELLQVIPSGQTPIFSNRVHWAKTYLKKAGLLDSPKRGSITITKKGLDVLKENPLEINVKFLRRFPEFLEFHSAKRSDITSSILSDDLKEQTPAELLDSGYNALRKALEEEISSKLKSVHPSFFERIVVELLVKMGYGGSIAEAGKATKYTNDEGIDGIIKEDKLGLDVIYIQAKRWEGVVHGLKFKDLSVLWPGKEQKKVFLLQPLPFQKKLLVMPVKWIPKLF